MHTVEIGEVRQRFGATVALDGVTFAVGSGITGLLGPNGAGKTTLLRVVSTVLAPDSGTVRLLGLDPRDGADRLAIRRRLGYLPQEPGFHRGFTVFDFVDYVAILKELTERRARHDEVRRVLAAVDLAAQSGKRIRTLSGGQRHRVALAQALLGDPDLLVLDEPTAGLDPEQRLRFRELVSSHADGRTVLISTHQTEDVAALCAQVVVLHRGSVLFAGPPVELAGVARGRVWLGDDRPAGATVAWRTGDGRYRVLGVEPERGEPIEPSLEDGYMLLVGAEAASKAEVVA